MSKRKISGLSQYHIPPSLLECSTGLFADKKSREPVEKPVTKEFLENYRYQGKVPVKHILCHLAYIMSLLANREISMYQMFPHYNFPACFHMAKDALCCICADFPPLENGEEALSVSYDYLYDASFFHAYDNMSRQGMFYSLYSIVAGLWEQGYYSDAILPGFLKMILRKLRFSAGYKMDKTVEWGPWQFAGFCLVSDFLQQLGEQDFTISESVANYYQQMKNSTLPMIKFSDKCKKIGKSQVIEMLEIMQENFYDEETPENIETVYRMRPYVSDSAAMMIDLAKEGKLSIDSVIRECFFSTLIMSEETLNGRFIITELQASIVKKLDETKEKYEETIESQKTMLSKQSAELKELKSSVKKLKKENVVLQAEHDSHQGKIAPELEKSQEKINELTQEITELRTQNSELKQSSSADRSKSSKYKTKIDSLQEETEKLKKEQERLQYAYAEQKEITETLNEELKELIQLYTATEENNDRSFSEDDLNKAQNAKLTFLVPSFVDSTPLEQLFPNSSFFKVQEMPTFDIGYANQGIVMCTKGISHPTAWRVENQAKSYGKPITYVASYGLRSMFAAAIGLLNQTAQISV